jgi:DNA invertase Pin-like site-specific DNA recombinase
VDAGGQFRSLADPWADTATRTGRLMIAVLGGLAEVERDLIRTRTAEGRSRATTRGQHMGRPPKLTPQQHKEARRRRAEGATLKELANSYNVGAATISRQDPRFIVSGQPHVALRAKLVLQTIAAVALFCRTGCTRERRCCPAPPNCRQAVIC